VYKEDDSVFGGGTFFPIIFFTSKYENKLPSKTVKSDKPNKDTK